MRLRALDRKLLRDLRGIRGQAAAIALVVAAGMSMFVMYMSNFDSLLRTQRAYYERQRFADVFASVKRAPEPISDRLAAIPGVHRVESRVVADVVLDVPAFDEPATGRLISVPATQRPALNDLFLRQGAWVDAGRPDGVLASEVFAQAHQLHVGDRIGAVINGRKRQLTIVGLALSPEYIYSIRPGELIPDDRRFGVLWMERHALAAAFDMEGAFNDVVLALEPDASPEAVMAGVDRVLAPYGGRGAIPRAQQLSNWTLDNELAQLRGFGLVVPAIFLIVAVFVLNVALTRMLALQRAQIAALKALGYRNAELARHYIKLALLIAGAGALLGVAAGAWLGAGMIELYNQYFRFPVLLYRLSTNVVLGAVTLGLGAAVLGAFTAVRRAVSVPPAEAMRPEPPARYRRSFVETRWLRARLSIATRMILRNLERQPFRAAASVTGISFAGAILLVGFVFLDAMQELIVTQFSIAARDDASVTFVEPASPRARYALQRLPGVLYVEPMRSVAARLRVGHRHRTVALTGIDPDARLRRVVDRSGAVVAVPPAGLLLSATLARVLDCAPGDVVTVEILEGSRPTRDLMVTRLVDDTMGLSAYMTLDALHRLMREGPVLSGAAMSLDPAQSDVFAETLKDVPAIAGVSFRRAALESFRETLAANMNLMISFNVLFAGIIAFGVVYNAARVSLSERTRELASLRVLGFTRAEISLILMGELAILTLLALPIGAVLGQGLATLIVTSMESEVYRFPLTLTARAVAWSALTVVVGSMVSGLVVRRRLDRLDLVGVLKAPE